MEPERIVVYRGDGEYLFWQGIMEYPGTVLLVMAVVVAAVLVWGWWRRRTGRD